MCSNDGTTRVSRSLRARENSPTRWLRRCSANVDESVPAHAERLRRALVPLVEQHYDDAASRLLDLETLVVATGKAAAAIGSCRGVDARAAGLDERSRRSPLDR